MGNEAARCADAVAATTHGSDAVWYNPAGLGAAEKSSLDLTSTAFALRYQRIPDGSELLLQDGTALRDDLNSTRLLIVPTSLVYARRLTPKLAAGAGVFVPELDYFRFQQDVGSFTDSEGANLRHHADVSGSRTRYHLGAALAWAPRSNYRVGVSWFVVYESLDRTARFWWNLDNANSSAVLLGEERASIWQVGTELTLALQADPTDSLHLSLVLRGPRLALGQSVRGDAIFIGGFEGPQFTATGDAELTFSFNDLEEATEEPNLLDFLAPPRVATGVAIDHDHGTLSFELDLSPPLTNGRTDFYAETTLNARLAATYDTSELISLGGGVFTDRAQNDDVSGFPDFNVDYYGASLGVSVGTPLELDEEDRNELVFETTLGLRYAIGRGKASAITFDFSGVDASEFIVAADRTREVTFHEASLHIGSGLQF